VSLPVEFSPHHKGNRQASLELFSRLTVRCNSEFIGAIRVAQCLINDLPGT
jgi:hypothetical protein